MIRCVGRPAAALLLPGLLVLASACSSAPSPAAATSPTGAGSTPASASPSASAATPSQPPASTASPASPRATGPAASGSATPGSAGPVPAGPPGPGATAAPLPPLASRPGAVPAEKRVVAAPAPFNGAARYADGVVLEVLGITHDTVTDKGVGVTTGQARTTVRLQLTNRSTRPVNLDRVVVQATYGADRATAAPVYGAAAADFSGTAAPGASRTAAYAFAVPPAAFSDVTMGVDLDGLHSTAVFRGSVR